MKIAVAVGFWRRDAVGVVAAVLALRAHLLLVPEDVQLVARRELRREAGAAVVPGLVVERLAREVGIVGPLRRVAGVLVVVHVRDVSLVALCARGREEPQAIDLERAAHGA